MNKQTLYQQAIKEAYPTLDIHSARLHTTEGQFNDVLFVNDDLLFRFPRYAESIHDFLQEIEILQKLQGRVNLPIPHPIYFSSGTEAAGKVFMGYKILAGKPLFRKELNAIRNEAALELLAQQLAIFLHGLHHLSPVTLGLHLPVSDQCAKLRTFFAEVKEHLFSFMRPEARDSVVRYFEDYFSNPNLHGYQASLIHGDFGGSNILFERDRITGIIDFSFAGLDDPAQDIAAISTYGEAFFARICRYYPNIEPLLERAISYRGTFALQEALHGFHNNDQQAFANGMEQYV